MSRKPLPKVRAAVLWAAVGLSGAASLSCSETPDEGGVMVIVTTDLAVPTDIDTLAWSVTLNGETKPFASGTLPLASPAALPATLAVAAGPATTEPVTIHVEGLSGGEFGTARVSSDARLVVPADSVKELPMPLDFLCMPASLASPCQAGETCRYGECVSVDVNVPATLNTYQATDAPACFDPLGCLRRFDAEPLPTHEGDACFIKGTDARLAPNVNLALIVNTPVVGTYGTCDPELGEKCVVPLPRGGPGGWEPPSQANQGRIHLPNAVCNAIGRSVAGVLVTPSSGTCPTLKRGTPLCEVPEACVEPDGVCPSDWGPRWSGYACAGKASPGRHFGRCFVPHQATAHGLSCCENDSPEVDDGSDRDPLLIDDMTLGPTLKITAPPGYKPGTWWTAVEDGASSISPDPDFFDYRAIEPPFSTPDGEISKAACLRSEHGFSAYLAMMGVDWLEKFGMTGPAATLDVSEYSGIRFYAMAKPPFAGFAGFSKDLVVLFPNVDTLSYGMLSTCRKETDICDDFRTTVPITEHWTEYQIAWTDLAQQGFGEVYSTFDKRLYEVIFASPGPGATGTSQPFDFCVSQIYFVKDAESAEEPEP